MGAKRERLAIYGSSGFAREVAWLAEMCSLQGKPRETVAFIDDDPDKQGTIINAIPVLSLEDVADRYPGALVVVGVGSPSLRRKLVEKTISAGLAFDTLIHRYKARSRWLVIDVVTVICAGNILTTNIEIGKHVQLNLDCTIGHDVIMAEFTTLAPGVHVSGWVHFEKETYCGTGATIINGTKESPLIIGERAVVGAGACVTKSVAPDITVVGVPARPLNRS
jgi:sugar O-acyltransferase (sialic acid O-acetyltransferase NeuD family)